MVAEILLAPEIPFRRLKCDVIEAVDISGNVCHLQELQEAGPGFLYEGYYRILSFLTTPTKFNNPSLVIGAYVDV